jgi:hypothetical protein
MYGVFGRAPCKLRCCMPLIMLWFNRSKQKPQGPLSLPRFSVHLIQRITRAVSENWIVHGYIWSLCTPDGHAQYGDTPLGTVRAWPGHISGTDSYSMEWCVEIGSGSALE